MTSPPPLAELPREAPVRVLRAAASRALETAGVESPLLDAGLLLAHVLGWPRHRLSLEPDFVPSEAERARFDELLAGRLERRPVAYLLGEKEFYGLPFRVGPGVLVPRPDSETLVELALARIPGDGAGFRVADIGTGSGCLAATLAHHRPAARVLAVELSSGALPLARANLAPSPERAPRGVWLVQGDLAACLAPESLDLMVSNPPYVDPATSPELAPELDHEPPGALFAAERGLACVRELLPQARRVLRPGAWLVLEHGFDQGAAIREIAEAAGLVEVSTARDLGRRERCLLARQPRAPGEAAPGPSGGNRAPLPDPDPGRIG